MQIGDKIRLARENKGRSREYLAQLLELDVRTVGKIENNERDLGLREASKIAKALDLTPQELIFGEPRLVFENCHQNGEMGMLYNAGTLHHSGIE